MTAAIRERMGARRSNKRSIALNGSRVLIVAGEGEQLTCGEMAKNDKSTCKDYFVDSVLHRDAQLQA